MFSEILTNLQLTIKDISTGSGIPRSTIADLINGKTGIEKMSVGNLYKLSQYLKLNMQDLFIYCLLPEVTDVRSFLEQENNRIIEDGLKIYVNELAENNLVETTYALHDNVRFQKYMTAVRDFHHYRKLQMPERYADYVLYLD